MRTIRSGCVCDEWKGYHYYCPLLSFLLPNASPRHLVLYTQILPHHPQWSPIAPHFGETCNSGGDLLQCLWHSYTHVLDPIVTVILKRPKIMHNVQNQLLVLKHLYTKVNCFLTLNTSITTAIFTEFTELVHNVISIHVYGSSFVTRGQQIPTKPEVLATSSVAFYNSYWVSWSKAALCLHW